MNPNFDKDYESLVENDVCVLMDVLKTENKPLGHIHIEEILKCVMSMKSGKAADEQGITSEHLKYGGKKLIAVLSKLINYIFANVHLPSALKSGISCPVYKRGGKPRDEPNSYRKITVTSTIGKVVEKLHLEFNSDDIKSKQSRLQKRIH